MVGILFSHERDIFMESSGNEMYTWGVWNEIIRRLWNVDFHENNVITNAAFSRDGSALSGNS